MRIEIGGRPSEPGSVLREALRAVARLEAAGEGRPIVVAYHPVSPLNPYQALLYRRAWDSGIAPVALVRLEHVDHLLGLVELGVRVVLHLHWTHGILHRAATPETARAALDAFVARLDRFLAGGGDLVWTVHNVLPHDSRRPGLEAELQQAIVDRASVIHVMSGDTANAASDVFSIPPERVLRVPHPGYVGAYPDVVERDQARHDLSVDPDETVYAMVGNIRPYKGLQTILAAFDLLPNEPSPRRLLVAGRPVADPVVEAFLDRCIVDPRVSLLEGAVDPADVQRVLRTADVAVLPYERSLNSGALLLALSFGLPVVAPATPSVEEIVDASFSRTFAPGDGSALAAAMLAADDLKTPAASASAMAAALRYDSVALSSEFATALRARLVDR